jgi:mono/diheme cytochrome c family protein
MICTECHGIRLTGDSAAGGGDARSPSLAGALGYSPEQFVTLMRTGTPRDTTTRLSLMADMARESLKYLTDDEISAVYNYIKALPATGVAR